MPPATEGVGVKLSHTATGNPTFSIPSHCFRRLLPGVHEVGTSKNFGVVNPTKIGTGSSIRTDQSFISRAELIVFSKAPAYRRT